MTMTRRHVWVVERWNPRAERWDATESCETQRSQARLQLRECRRKQKGTRFRLRRYDDAAVTG